MKRYVGAAFIAILVFSFSAMAASLSVGSSVLASGQGAVVGCTEDAATVTYSYDGGEPVWTGSEWQVNQATVELDPACSGLTMSLALIGIEGGGSSTVDEAGIATFAFGPINAERVTGHSIVVRD